MAKKEKKVSVPEKIGKDKIIKPGKERIVTVGGGSSAGKPNPTDPDGYTGPNLPPGLDPAGPRLEEILLNRPELIDKEWKRIVVADRIKLEAIIKRMEKIEQLLQAAGGGSSVGKPNPLDPDIGPDLPPWIDPIGPIIKDEILLNRPESIDKEWEQIVVADRIRLEAVIKRMENLEQLLKERIINK